MSTIKATYKECLLRMREVSALSSVAGLLSWDQETMMPQGAAAVRAEQSAAIAGVVHEKFVDPQMGDMLRKLQANADKLTFSERVVVRERLRDYEKSIKLPPSLVREMARVASQAQSVWIQARAASDFKKFAPWLKKTVDLKRQQAEAYGYEDHPYDALLDDYEPRMTIKELDPVIDNLRGGLVPIIDKILHAETTLDNSLLKRLYPQVGQEAVGRELMRAMRMSASTSRLDRSAHPFCAGIASPTDVRITARYNERYLPQALYGIIHESGHALYEQGLEEKHIGTPLAEAVSLGIHESQSRLWENIIGRSRNFVAFLFSLLKKHFPQALSDVTEDDFYKAINRVTPTFIRVEADEVTYNMHIVLRYEIEKALLTGDMQVKDLPGIWNDGMEDYLEIRPDNDAQGVLQDTHWASGLVGYFPTYLLGNLYAAQFWYMLSKNVSDVDRRIARGEFQSILDWLRKHIHRHGRAYSSSELVNRVTGKPLSATYFLDYLKAKYSELYNIQHWD